MKLAFRTAWPLIVAIIGTLPVVAACGQVFTTGNEPVPAAVQAGIAALLVAAFTAAWLRFREPARAWWKNFQEEGQQARRGAPGCEARNHTMSRTHPKPSSASNRLIVAQAGQESAGRRQQGGGQGGSRSACSPPRSQLRMRIVREDAETVILSGLSDAAVAEAVANLAASAYYSGSPEHTFGDGKIASTVEPESPRAVHATTYLNIPNSSIYA